MDILSLVISIKKILITLLSILCLFLLFNNYSYPENIKELRSQIILDANENEIYSLTNGHERTYIKDIPQKIKDCFIKIEDKNFYSHHGFDILRIIKASITNLFSKKQGASTITQQLARMLFLNNEKTYKRKIQELVISLRLEKAYSKDEILECYLNNLYFGHGVYGIYDASIYFFNKTPNSLDLNEIALLVGIIKGPSVYSPINNYTLSMERKNAILKKLESSEGSYNPIIYGIKKEKYNSPVLFYKDLVISSLKKDTYGRIYTNYDSSLGSMASSSDASIVAIEPESGKIRLITSGNYYQSSYNKALFSKRQIGSTVKPFLYYQALLCGMNPLSKFKSEESSIIFDNEVYSPKNYHNKYENEKITMCYALATSDNIYAVKTHKYIGPDKLASILNQLNISAIPQPSLALGTCEATLLELALAYAALANTGYLVKPYLVEKIIQNNKTIYQASVQKEKKLSYENTIVINNMLKMTFDKNLNNKMMVTGNSIADSLAGIFAGKSGSTFHDAYMIGFNKKIVIGVHRGSLNYQETFNDGGITKKLWASLINNYANDDFYDDDNIKKIYANPTGLNQYKCYIYMNDYLLKYGKKS